MHLFVICTVMASPVDIWSHSTVPQGVSELHELHDCAYDIQHKKFGAQYVWTRDYTEETHAACWNNGQFCSCREYNKHQQRAAVVRRLKTDKGCDLRGAAVAAGVALALAGAAAVATGRLRKGVLHRKNSVASHELIPKRRRRIVSSAINESESFTLAKQPGDGNCLFHALAHCVALSDTARSLRRDIAKFIKQNRSLCFSGFERRDAFEWNLTLQDWIAWDSNCSVDAYTRRIATQGTWGGSIEIAVCARIKHVNVDVYENCTLCGGVVYVSSFDCPGADKTVHILWQGTSLEIGEHYDALVPLRQSRDSDCRQLCDHQHERLTVAPLDVISIQIVLFVSTLMCGGFAVTLLHAQLDASAIREEPLLNI
eukprot:gnl/TRDRNA2_/TRDRNA2_34771_c0_seq1.p1 gnl/TRDRNA2_/TRDRNA2_34771_c0~~gnl/TRDRNA2_/TRDRNA2_34771_c0_seq1.p1  ORF type:complete len:370 (+),score=19.07 gnl/TRDRNA2_/TRDRNA2_34771_c0_seq1:224-1333(+)